MRLPSARIWFAVRPDQFNHLSFPATPAGVERFAAAFRSTLEVVGWTKSSMAAQDQRERCAGLPERTVRRSARRCYATRFLIRWHVQFSNGFFNRQVNKLRAVFGRLALLVGLMQVFWSPSPA
ncbi:hypothetical protein KCP78_20510 [Salmonella enterica subsp. enterica]|nr:hypothetical protein KCP78_20510 [Salmonella enterica subsp. enterica]